MTGRWVEAWQLAAPLRTNERLSEFLMYLGTLTEPARLWAAARLPLGARRRHRALASALLVGLHSGRRSHELDAAPSG